MSLYGFLADRFGHRLSALLAALLYAVIIALIILLLPMEAANFRYGSY